MEISEKNINYKDEIRIGIVGNIDAGKSTFVGVLSHNKLDNGRGEARERIMKHQHEIKTGRTSDIATQFLNYDTKIIELIDLAGHEKYLKTTIKGIQSNIIDYAGVIINANSGIQIMTREHISLVYTLKIPIFIVYTKIDITPSNIYDTNLGYISTFITKQLRLIPKCINTIADFTDVFASYIEFENNRSKFIDNLIVPIIPMSNTTGIGIDLIKYYLANLRQYRNYKDSISKPVNFNIQTVYHVSGIGLVLSGLLISGKVHKNDILYLGPIHKSFDGYVKVLIRSIHDNFKTSIQTLYAGQNGCFNIKTISHQNINVTLKREMITTGMRLLPIDTPISVMKFDARVRILHNPSTITKTYNPVIHCAGICQTATIENMNKEYLRTNDEAQITFKFMYHSEYIETGNIFVFRDGLTKGIGQITKIY